MTDFLGVDIRVLLLAMVTVVNTILATLIYLRSKERSSMFFVLAIISTAIWAFGISFYTQPGLTPLSKLWSNMNYSIACVIAISYFFFTFYFGSEERALSNKIRIFSVAFLIFVIFLVQVPYEPLSVISTLELLPNGLKQETFGWGYPVYLVFLVGYFFAGIAILIAKYFSSKDPQFKNQLVYILFGTGLSIFIGITTNLILPHFGSIGYEWAGPLGTVVMILSIAYAITKHKLWNFKILAIQLFVALMILTLLLQVFVSQNPTEQIARGIIFFIVTVFSYFLVKNLLREVEDRERMEKLADELSHANERLKIIDVEKSDFVSITSHQFRTPLTVIKGYTSMLQEGSFGVVRNDKIKDALDKIYRASERLVVTIEEFLNISRIEQNQMTYIPEKVDLRKLTGTTIEEASVSLKEADIALTFHAQITEEYFVKVDPAKIKLVIHNIIDNAIKYTPKGGKILVTLHKQPSTKTILLGVKDTGIGMTPDIQNRLFEKFSRGPGTSKLHTEGRGLGLFVARQIMKAQGGKIWAESEGKDKGSIFYLEFPDWEYVRQRQEVKEFVGAL